MKARMNVYFEPELLRKVDELAAHRSISKSLIVEAAVASFLSPDAQDRREAAITRRLDRLTRQIDRLERNLGILSETLALYVRFWLIVTPPMPESAQAAARTTGAERYQAFVDAVGRRIANGHNFFNELASDTARPRTFHHDSPTAGAEDSGR